GRHVFVSSTALGLAEGRHGAAKILRPNPPHLAHAQAGRLSDRFGAHVVFDSQPHALEATLLHRPGFLLERQFQLLDLFRARFLSGSHFTTTYITSSLNASLYKIPAASGLCLASGETDERAAGNLCRPGSKASWLHSSRNGALDRDASAGRCE